MHKAVFVDIDTQADFMMPRGRLYVRGAFRLIPKIRRLTACADSLAIPVISSVDAHSKRDPEFCRFPAHCVRNSPGARKIPAGVARSTRQIVIAKRTFDMFDSPRAAKALKKFDTAYVYGVALEYCVRAACLGIRSLGLRTYLVEDATLPVSAAAGKKTLRELRSAGVVTIRTAQVVRRMTRCRKKSVR